MAFTIDSSIGVGGMLQQMQRMQDHMKTLSAAAQERPQSYVLSPEHMQSEGVKANSQTESVRAPSAADSVGEFADLLHNALESVNTLQNNADSMQTRFDIGDRSVTLADVMLASQKSRIAFEATVQVRNKMVEAYRTISQMQL